MQSEQIKRAILKQANVKVHLVSGEIFEGTCVANDHHEILQLRTDSGILGFPMWMIKYVSEI